jgi:hypothetical protein
MGAFGEIVQRARGGGLLFASLDNVLKISVVSPTVVEPSSV